MNSTYRGHLHHIIWGKKKHIIQNTHNLYFNNIKRRAPKMLHDPQYQRAYFSTYIIHIHFLSIENYTKLHIWMLKKVKCTLVRALRLCTGRMTYRGSIGVALPFLDHGTNRGWGVSVTPRLLFTPGKDPVPIVQEAGWAPGPVWTGAENLVPTGIQSPDCPACSQSLYQPHYPAHKFFVYYMMFIQLQSWLQSVCP
jgi:hypothetical protein